MVAKTRRSEGIVPKARRKPRVEGEEADPADPACPAWTGWSIKGTQPALPDAIKRVYDEQLAAVEEIAKKYAGGARVVFLDAPTGSGKSLVGELVRRKMEVARGLYLCSTKSLQEQYLASFPYARVLKGRVNYTPTKLARTGRGWKSEANRNDMGITCLDCDKGPPGVPATEQTCSYCHLVEECPYLVARQEAAVAPVGVLNTAYFLAHCNTTGDTSPFKGRELVVADEADLLEGELLGYVELRVGKRVVERNGLEVPKKGSHMTTIRAWLEGELLPKLVEDRKRVAGGGSLEDRREHARLDSLIRDVHRVIEREEGWVRDNDEEGRNDSLVLKPVSVEDVGERFLWRHAERWLCMTGTLVSAEAEAESLGLEQAGIGWDVVKVPMAFDAENRRVVFAPVGNMTRKGQEAGGVAKVLRGVERVLEKHPGVNVLVHTHTYKLAREVADGLREWGRESGDGRPVITYDNARNRDSALGTFKAASRQQGGVLVASSMDRGVDLPGELCRVQVVCKVPMASLGSRQVSERLRTAGGELWYLANTVRTILQMCGRAVRGRDDWAITYVLDEHFGKVLKDGKKWGLWPEWWLEALEVGKVREYM